MESNEKAGQDPAEKKDCFKKKLELASKCIVSGTAGFRLLDPAGGLKDPARVLKGGSGPRGIMPLCALPHLAPCTGFLAPRAKECLALVF
jgi:hypothetical protein